jgi:hypothetical protein
MNISTLIICQNRSNRERLHHWKKMNSWSLGFYLRGDLFEPVQGRRNRRVGWSPDWGEWEDSPDPLHGHTSWLLLLWGMFVRIVLLDWLLVGSKILWRYWHILEWKRVTGVRCSRTRGDGTRTWDACSQWCHQHTVAHSSRSWILCEVCGVNS